MTLTNPEFGQEVSKARPKIVSANDGTQVVPKRLNFNFSTLTTYTQSLGYNTISLEIDGIAKIALIYTQKIFIMYLPRRNCSNLFSIR